MDEILNQLYFGNLNPEESKQELKLLMGCALDDIYEGLDEDAAVVDLYSKVNDLLEEL